MLHFFCLLHARVNNEKRVGFHEFSSIFKIPHEAIKQYFYKCFILTCKNVDETDFSLIFAKCTEIGLRTERVCEQLVNLNCNCCS